MKAMRHKKVAREDTELAEETTTFDSDGKLVGPLIVDCGQGSAIWNFKRECWMKRDRLGKLYIPEDTMELFYTCWCGTQVYYDKNLSQEMKDYYHQEFMSQHKYCGKRRKRVKTSQVIELQISEE